MISLLRKLFVKIAYVRWALARNGRPHLGDVVFYDGVKCSLIQGAADPCWDLLPMTEENLAKQKRDIHYNVHVSYFKLDNSLKRKWWAFKSDYKFKMVNWYQIDIRGSLFAKTVYIK